MTAGTTTRYCKACDYPLDTAPEHRCPECGRGFSPDDPRTFAAKPHARRRRWMRRLVIAAALLLLLWLLAPREIIRITLAWPSPDHSFVSSRTYWIPLAPRWLPFRYPTIKIGATEAAFPASGSVNAFSFTTRTLQTYRYSPAGGWRFDIPNQPGFVGCINVETFDPATQALLTRRSIPILPEYIDEVIEVCVYDRAAKPNQRIMVSPIQRSLIPPNPPTPPTPPPPVPRP